MVSLPKFGGNKTTPYDNTRYCPVCGTQMVAGSTPGGYTYYCPRCSGHSMGIKTE